MMNEDFIKGLKFSCFKELSPREIEVLLILLNGPQTVDGLIKLVDINKSTLYSIIQKLRFKDIVSVKNRTSLGSSVYQLSIEQEN